MSPGVYGFFSNVMPAVPHPNWKQETETMLGTLEKRATLPFNGYGEWVAGMYPELGIRGQVRTDHLHRDRSPARGQPQVHVSHAAAAEPGD